MNGERDRAPLRYREDDRLNNRDRILGFLGGGGYSAVYEAYDEYLDENIALKVFAPTTASTPFDARSRRFGVYDIRTSVR